MEEGKNRLARAVNFICHNQLYQNLCTRALNHLRDLPIPQVLLFHKSCPSGTFFPIRVLCPLDTFQYRGAPVAQCTLARKQSVTILCPLFQFVLCFKIATWKEGKSSALWGLGRSCLSQCSTTELQLLQPKPTARCNRENEGRNVAASSSA